MDKESKESYNVFLNIAESYGLRNKTTEIKNSTNQVDYGNVLLSIASAQEDIEALKQKLRTSDVNREYDVEGCTHNLANLLAGFNTKLKCLLAETGSIESKLSNPVIKNSLPLAADSQQDLIQATLDLANVVENADRLLGSASWLGDQDWPSILRTVEDIGAKLDSSASRLRTSYFSVQQLRSMDLK
jgi:hypothetical protein